MPDPVADPMVAAMIKEMDDNLARVMAQHLTQARERGLFDDTELADLPVIEWKGEVQVMRKLFWRFWWRSPAERFSKPGLAFYWRGRNRRILPALPYRFEGEIIPQGVSYQWEHGPIIWLRVSRLRLRVHVSRWTGGEFSERVTRFGVSVRLMVSHPQPSQAGVS